MVNKKLDIIIVGLGYWGKNFLRLVNNTDIFNLVAIVDAVIDKESRGWIARADKSFIQNLLIKEPIPEPKAIKLPKLKKV